MALKKSLVSIIASGLFILNTVNASATSNYDDKIHFLPVKGGDAILIESNGKFALVDGGEDTGSPREFKSLQGGGYEKEVVNYIKKVAGDKNGKVTLEWIVGTHAHSDHLGGLDTVVESDDIYVKKGYLKKYDESKISINEVNEWDNKEVYEQLINALKKEGSEIIQNISSTPFKLGDLSIQFYNTENNSNKKGERVGENENSLGLLVTKNKQRVFLAGDINNLDGDEDLIGNQLGKVDLLKVGHHGYNGSSSLNFLNKLKPTYSIMTNYDTNINHTVSKNLKTVKTKLYSTIGNNGIIAVFDKEDFGLSEYNQSREWVFENGKWYFKNNQNQCIKGWVKLNWNNKIDWYYFDNNGVMKTGWIYLNNEWYYLNEVTDSKGNQGAMLVGTHKLKWNNKWSTYTFNNLGQLI